MWKATKAPDRIHMHQGVVVSVLIADLAEDVAAGVLRVQLLAMHIGHVEEAPCDAVIGFIETLGTRCIGDFHRLSI